MLPQHYMRIFEYGSALVNLFFFCRLARLRAIQGPLLPMLITLEHR